MIKQPHKTFTLNISLYGIVAPYDYIIILVHSFCNEKQLKVLTNVI